MDSRPGRSSRLSLRRRREGGALPLLGSDHPLSIASILNAKTTSVTATALAARFTPAIAIR